MICRGLFVCEGTSDIPLGTIVEDLLRDAGVDSRVVRPDLSRIRRVAARQLAGKIEAALSLNDGPPDFLVVHRDVDRTSDAQRRDEIRTAAKAVGLTCPVICVLPQTMTESWLLVDADEIRVISGNPQGTIRLNLPSRPEDVSDSKRLLAELLFEASELHGRRAKRLRSRFPESRRELLERLDRTGPVRSLGSFGRLLDDVARAAARL